VAAESKCVLVLRIRLGLVFACGCGCGCLRDCVLACFVSCLHIEQSHTPKDVLTILL
jgi:hypothetical protein